MWVSVEQCLISLKENNSHWREISEIKWSVHPNYKSKYFYFFILQVVCKLLKDVLLICTLYEEKKPQLQTINQLRLWRYNNMWPCRVSLEICSGLLLHYFHYGKAVKLSSSFPEPKVTQFYCTFCFVHRSVQIPRNITFIKTSNCSRSCFKKLSRKECFSILFYFVSSNHGWHRDYYAPKCRSDFCHTTPLQLF